MHLTIRKSIFISTLVLCLCSCVTNQAKPINFATEYSGGEVYSMAITSDGWGPNIDTSALLMKYVIQTADSTVVIAKGLNRQDFKYSMLADELYIVQANGARKRLKGVKNIEPIKYSKIALTPDDEAQFVFERVDPATRFSIFASRSDKKPWKIFSNIDLAAIKAETGSQYID